MSKHAAHLGKTRCHHNNSNNDNTSYYCGITFTIIITTTTTTITTIIITTETAPFMSEQKQLQSSPLYNVDWKRLQ